MKDKQIVYEPHPVSAERKKELIAKGFKIIDEAFQPETKKPAAKVSEAKNDKASK